MSSKAILGLAAAAIVCSGLIYFGGGHQAPAGQPPLVELTSRTALDLKRDFNAAQGETRMLVLLSPT